MTEKSAIQMLATHRIMAISTIRPDGWPQNTIVGYANESLAIYFQVVRSSQKFANILHDDRVSIAVANEAKDILEVEAVFAGERRDA